MACLHTPKNEHTGITPTHTDTHSLWVWLSFILFISHEWWINAKPNEKKKKKKNIRLHCYSISHYFWQVLIFFILVSDEREGLERGIKQDLESGETIWDTLNDPVYAEFCLGFVFHSFFFILYPSFKNLFWMAKFEINTDETESRA